jgi:hypothetical protein
MKDLISLFLSVFANYNCALSKVPSQRASLLLPVPFLALGVWYLLCYPSRYPYPSLSSLHLPLIFRRQDNLDLDPFFSLTSIPRPRPRTPFPNPLPPSNRPSNILPILTMYFQNMKSTHISYRALNVPDQMGPFTQSVDFVLCCAFDCSVCLE